MRSFLWRWGLALVLGTGWGWAMSPRGGVRPAAAAGDALGH